MELFYLAHGTMYYVHRFTVQLRSSLEAHRLRLRVSLIIYLPRLVYLGNQLLLIKSAVQSKSREFLPISVYKEKNTAKIRLTTQTTRVTLIVSV